MIYVLRYFGSTRFRQTKTRDERKTHRHVWQTRPHTTAAICCLFTRQSDLIWSDLPYLYGRGRSTRGLRYTAQLSLPCVMPQCGTRIPVTRVQAIEGLHVVSAMPVQTISQGRLGAETLRYIKRYRIVGASTAYSTSCFLGVRTVESKSFLRTQSSFQVTSPRCRQLPENGRSRNSETTRHSTPPSVRLLCQFYWIMFTLEPMREVRGR